MTELLRVQEGGGLLFDLDGTIVDSDPLHRKAFAAILEPAGHDVTEAFFARHIHGKKVAEIFATLMPDDDPKALDAQKEQIFRQLLAESDLQAAPGLTRLLDAAARQGVPCAIATNGSLENALAAVDKLGIAGSFGAIVAAELVARGKPAPDVYLAAAERVGVDPARSVAFEDSLPGIAAAKAAGCKVFGLTTGLSAEILLAHGADRAIADFTSDAVAGLVPQTAVRSQ